MLFFLSDQKLYQSTERARARESGRFIKCVKVWSAQSVYTTHKIFSNSMKREIHMGLPNQFHLSIVNTSLNCLRYQCSNVFYSLKILERLQNELERVE